jgi:hypothetical protein
VLSSGLDPTQEEFLWFELQVSEVSFRFHIQALEMKSGISINPSEEQTQNPTIATHELFS